MGRMTTWWRKLGGLMVACVLTLLVVAPTVSMAACVCESDAPIVSVEIGETAGQAVQGEHRDSGAPCEAACCVGGHCHHGGAMLETSFAAASAPVPVASSHAMALAHALASRTISGPDRPPRA